MPTGAMTLIESAKTMPRSHAQDVIMTYAMAYQPMSVLPLQEAPGGNFPWNIEYELPYTTGGTRNINGTWTATRSEVSPFSEQVKIYGGEVQVDRALQKLNPAKTPQEQASQIKARAYRFTIDMFQGSGGSTLRGIDHWITNEPIFSNQNVNVGTASAGGTLVTDDLDEILSKVNVVPGRTFIYCTDVVGRRISKLSRGTNASGDISYQNRFDPTQWGFFSGNYAGVPIVVLKDGKGTSLFSTTDGDGSSSSMYVVTYGPEMFTGFSVGMPEVIPLSQADVYNYFDFEWLVGTAPQAIRSIARARYISETV